MERMKDKSKRRLVAVLLCIVLVLAGTMTVFAQEETEGAEAGAGTTADDV